MSDELRALSFTHHSSLITALTSSANEVNNLNAVAFFEVCLRPVGAANYPAVQLYCQPFRSEREMLYEVCERD
jgi:hypothetical protein